MERTRHGAGPIAMLVGVLLVVLVVPAYGQQPYPPPPPPDGPPARAQASCEVEAPRTITCEGEGYLAGSTVTIEIHAVGRQGRGRLIAADAVDVDDDGTWEYRRALGCETPAERVRVRVSGRDANDRSSTHTFQLDVGPPPDGCDQMAAGEDAQQAGADDDSPGPADVAADVRQRDAGPAIGGVHLFAGADTTSDGSLALTGRNLVLLAALALVLVTFGTVLVSARRGRRGAPAH